MIIRDTPKITENYIRADKKANSALSKMGFLASYIDTEYVYYKKTKEIINAMEKEGF